MTSGLVSALSTDRGRIWLHRHTGISTHGYDRGARTSAGGAVILGGFVRIPLYIKLMTSYLLVVGLVVIPSFFYVQTIQQRELHANLEREVQIELDALADRLQGMGPEEAPSVVRDLRGLFPHRITLIDVDGRVLADSTSTGSFESHADRPEFQAALTSQDGFGSITRLSTTTGEEYLYTARRYPASGPPRGVIRLAVSTNWIRLMESKASSFLNRTCAASLSAALLLSLVAAVVLSRPLKRIAEGARAFARGDFAHAIDVRSNDEIGDVGHALDDLAARLRDRLLSAGADRATLQALLDELPLGVIVYTTDREPALLSGRARQLCDLDPTHEVERAQALIADPAQAAIVDEVLGDGVARDAELRLPWKSDHELTARWIALYSADGKRQPAVALSEGRDRSRAARALADASRMLAKAGSAVSDPELAAALFDASDEAVAACDLPLPTSEEIAPTLMSSLCARAREEIDGLLRHHSVGLDVSFANSDARIPEAGDRALLAVRSLLAVAVRGATEGTTLQVRGESFDGHWRLRVEQRIDKAALRRIAHVVRGLGGDAGAPAGREVPEAWLLFPRA
jgi:HAMP domain-containing protein